MVNDYSYIYSTLEHAIANAQGWNGRCCVIASGDVFKVVSGNVDRALYVTIGMRYQDWLRNACDDCGHPHGMHKRHVNGARRCTSFGCGCEQA